VSWLIPIAIRNFHYFILKQHVPTELLRRGSKNSITVKSKNKELEPKMNSETRVTAILFICFGNQLELEAEGSARGPVERFNDS
jgi:GMP synthase-like glutamine amidotransferase